MTITWDWSTLDHWGNPVTPTGFIVERKLGTGNYRILSYDVAPAAREYTDQLTDSEALSVFGNGTFLSYRVRSYWIV
jgi:hypothetical protein